jgi:hypothetical protein
MDEIPRVVDRNRPRRTATMTLRDRDVREVTIW